MQMMCFVFFHQEGNQRRTVFLFAPVELPTFASASAGIGRGRRLVDGTKIHGDGGGVFLESILRSRMKRKQF